jgi:SAM-dependent methyltransferase
MGLKKLNLGCGRDYREGFVNIDISKEVKADVYHDLEKFPYPFKANTFDEILSLGVLELIDADFLKIMEELYRICKPNAVIKIRSPVFPNMCSAQDPLTKKFMTYNTFEYFKGDGGFDYYSKARFGTIKREYIFQ